jgi:long-subunit fatty acid transport protein
MLDYGRIEGRDNADNPYNYGANDFVIAGTYGGVFEENILVGVTLKSIQQKIENESTDMSMGVDLGGVYKLSENLSIGAAVQNFTIVPIKFVEQGYSLPMNIKIGVGFKTSGYSFENPTVFVADFNKPSDNSANVGFGGEYWLSELFTVRAGYKMQLGGSSDLGGTVGLTAGCGLKYILQSGHSLEIDFAIVPYGSIGSSVRLSVLLKFGE